MSLQQNFTIRLKRVLGYNRVRTNRAIELLPIEKRALFHSIPFLLHINHPDFPGYVEDEGTPFGIVNYNFKPMLKESLLEVFPNNVALIETMRSIWPRKRMIDSVLLMGSIGSIAQGSKSDFDYWVCVDAKKYQSKQLALLQQKLTLVEQWVDYEFDLEVHFFLSEIDKVKNNDFGEAGGESSGSAQAVFLKAEFYATNLMIAGKVPFWWLVPEAVTHKQYEQLYAALKQNEDPDPNWFMDLGHVEKLVPEEIFGAAIWQISKAMDSPFKSLLKMAKLEVFLDKAEQSMPLCNLLKKRVHHKSAGIDDIKNKDPYALMFDQLMDFYSKREDRETVELLQTCLYIKSECALTLPVTSDVKNFKREIIVNYVMEWGWDKARLKRLDNIQNWDFQEVSDLGKRIHNFLISCYRRISSKIQQQKQLVNVEDLTVIGRKLDSFYTKKDGKIVYLKRAFDEGLYVSAISIKAELDLGSTTNKKWMVFRGKRLDRGEIDRDETFLKESTDPVDLTLWCVFNRIINADTKIYLSYTCDPLKEEDLKAFIEEVTKLFPPIRISDLPREDLMAPSRILICLAVINFETWRNSADLESVRTIYLTSWGELYSVEGFDALAELRTALFGGETLPDTYVMTHDGPHKNRLYDEFKNKTQMEFQHYL